MDLTAAFNGLNDQERIYVQSRLQGMSQVASASAAGVSPANASRFESDPRIQQALDTGRAISIQSTGITRERVADMLLDAYRAATTAAEMVMAARELGRLHGVYAPQRVEMDHTHKLKGVKSEDDIRKLTTAELLQLTSSRGGDVIDADFTPVPSTRMLTHATQESG